MPIDVNQVVDFLVQYTENNVVDTFFNLPQDKKEQFLWLVNKQFKGDSKNFLNSEYKLESSMTPSAWFANELTILATSELTKQSLHESLSHTPAAPKTSTSSSSSVTTAHRPTEPPLLAKEKQSEELSISSMQQYLDRNFSDKNVLDAYNMLSEQSKLEFLGFVKSKSGTSKIKDAVITAELERLQIKDLLSLVPDAPHQSPGASSSSSSPAAPNWTPEEQKLFGTDLLNFLEKVPTEHINAARNPGIQGGDLELQALEQYASTQNVHINFYKRKANGSGYDPFYPSGRDEHISSPREGMREIHIIQGTGHYVNAERVVSPTNGTITFEEKKTRGDNNCLFNAYVQATEKKQYPADSKDKGWLQQPSEELSSKALLVRQEVCNVLESIWKTDQVVPTKKTENPIYARYYNLCKFFLENDGIDKNTLIDQLGITHDRSDDTAKKHSLPFKENLLKLLDIQKRKLTKEQEVVSPNRPKP